MPLPGATVCANLAIDFVVVTDIDQDDLLVGDDHFQRDAIAHVDRHTMQAFQTTLQWVKAQRWVVGVGLKKTQRL